MLKKFLIGTIAVFAFAVMANVALAFDFGPTTLKVGSKGPYVATLQTFLGVTADGSFGPMTKAKVMAWQASNGLTADGKFGPASMAKANAGSTPTCVAGQFDPMTGVLCGTTPTLPAGCTSAVGFSSTTGAKCDGTTGGTTPTPGVLTGGVGTLDYTTTSSGLESTMKEGEEDVKVLAFKAEADESDVKVTSLKVSLKNMDCDANGNGVCTDGGEVTTDSSEKLTNYMDEVTVWMGSTKVGSMNTSDFKRDSGSPDVFSKTISLTDAIVKDGVKATFYVAVTANSSIETTDMDSANWNVDVSTIWTLNAVGNSTSEDLSLDHDQNFSFEDVSTDDGMSIKTSSSNPSASTLKVDANNDSDEFLLGAFKLDVDDNSTDITVTEIPVVIDVVSGAVATSDDAEDIIKEVNVKIGGTTYSADLDSETIDNGDGTATYLVTLDSDELVMSGGDVEEVKVYATFTEQDGNYTSGTEVFARVTGSQITAEGADDNVTVTGTFTGKTHNLAVTGVTFTKVSSTETYVPTDQTIKGKYTLVFDVKNDGDEALYLPFGAVADADGNLVPDTDEEGLAFILENSSGVRYTAADAADLSISLEAADGDIEGTNTFMIDSGATERFTLTVSVDNTGLNAGAYRLAVVDATVTTDDVDGADTSAVDVAQNFTSVRTLTLQLNAA